MQNGSVCQRGLWDSVELPLGEFSPSYVPSCPNILASSTMGWDREAQEEDLEYIWLR